MIVWYGRLYGCVPAQSAQEGVPAGSCDTHQGGKGTHLERVGVALDEVKVGPAVLEREPALFGNRPRAEAGVVALDVAACVPVLIGHCRVRSEVIQTRGGDERDGPEK